MSRPRNTFRIYPIVADSGTFGFGGEGYWWHWIASPFIIWLRWFGTFASKTVTAEGREGNMPLNADGTPRERFPRCVFLDWKRWLKGGMLNAVSLSNFGVLVHLALNGWLHRKRSWMLSFMTVGETIEEKLEESRRFVDVIKPFLQHFQRLPIIVLNISCPNTGEELDFWDQNVHRILDVLAELGLAVIVKVSVDMPVKQVKIIASHQACTGIQVTNTLHWTKLPESILRRVFPDTWNEDIGGWVSPLLTFGGGGYSGKDLLPIVLRWVRGARDAGIEKFIIAGGGIFSPRDVWRLREAGANAVSIASPVILRPHMVPLIVLAAWLYDFFHERNVS